MKTPRQGHGTGPFTAQGSVGSVDIQRLIPAVLVRERFD